MTETLSFYYLESVEKALRGDKRFEHLLEEDTATWNLLTALHKLGVYTSYCGEMDYIGEVYDYNNS